MGLIPLKGQPLVDKIADITNPNNKAISFSEVQLVAAALLISSKFRSKIRAFDEFARPEDTL